MEAGNLVVGPVDHPRPEPVTIEREANIHEKRAVVLTSGIDPGAVIDSGSFNGGRPG